MPRIAVLSVSLVGALVAALAPGLAARQATPATGGMDTEATLAVMEAYTAAFLAGEEYGRYLADDVVLRLLDAGQEVRGGEAVVAAIDGLFEEAFAAEVEVGTPIVEPGAAGLEHLFVGTHTGDFAGIAATGRAVRVPYAVFYDLSGDEITELRVYGFAYGLLAQLTAEKPAAAGTPAG